MPRPSTELSLLRIHSPRNAWDGKEHISVYGWVATADSRLSRYAAWRSRRASPKQVQLLKKMKGLTEEDGSVVIKGKSVNLDEVNAGQIASLL